MTPERARTQLVIDSRLTWLGALACRLRLVADDSIETANVDGVTLRYNPQWFDALSPSQAVYTIAHETQHCALLHPFRRKGREARRWNEACDYAINNELIAAGFTAPAGALIDSSFHGMSAEAIYAVLSKRGDEPESDPNGTCDDAPSEDAIDGVDGATGDLEAEWTRSVKSAMDVAAKAGKGASEASKLAVNAARARTDWRAVLAPYFQLPGDYAWSRPARRFIGRGLYLPGTVQNRLRRVVLAIDTSGSINVPLLNRFSDELVSMFDGLGWPESVSVIYCDSIIRGEHELTDASEIKPLGGGGTCFTPIFDRLKEDEPDVLIYFTDMDAYDRESLAAPAYPVVWATPEGYAERLQHPFGERIILD